MMKMLLKKLNIVARGHGGERPHRRGYDHGGRRALPDRAHGQPHAGDGSKYNLIIVSFLSLLGRRL